MASSGLFLSILRPAVLHILRAAGFHGARAAAVDALVDIANRYMILLAEKTAEYALDHDLSTPNVTEVRMALEDVGALAPRISAGEEQLYYDDDLRGLEHFLAWMEGDMHKEMRRIAGLEATSGDVSLEGDAEREDFLTALKKKHSKTGEESRFQGTALGKQAADKALMIEGFESLPSIQAWQSDQRRKVAETQGRMDLTYDISAESSPLSDI